MGIEIQEKSIKKSKALYTSIQVDKEEENKTTQKPSSFIGANQEGDLKKMYSSMVLPKSLDLSTSLIKGELVDMVGSLFKCSQLFMFCIGGCYFG